jgi:hypothetical protein
MMDDVTVFAGGRVLGFCRLLGVAQERLSGMAGRGASYRTIRQMLRIFHGWDRTAGASLGRLRRVGACICAEELSLMGFATATLLVHTSGEVEADGLLS